MNTQQKWNDEIFYERPCSFQIYSSASTSFYSKPLGYDVPCKPTFVKLASPINEYDYPNNFMHNFPVNHKIPFVSN